MKKFFPFIISLALVIESSPALVVADQNTYQPNNQSIAEEEKNNSTKNLTNEQSTNPKINKVEKTQDNNTSKTFNLQNNTNTNKTVAASNIVESQTSRLGHIKNRDVKIYPNLNSSSYITAGAEYTNYVYYIKKQATVNNTLYYLISRQPSATSGVVGWVRAQDLSSHPHVTVDKKAKTFYIKGTGSAYAKAWGGRKDIVFEDLSKFKNQPFQVHLTETVGTNTWYRGTLNGKTVWIHSSYLSLANVKEQSTSRLGHIRNRDVKIYPSLDFSSYITAGAEYTNYVYYIKKQATVNNTLYYLISRQPSATSGVVGWVRAQDLSSHPHVTVDKQTKIFGIKGSGSAYAKAWGGRKDIVFEDLSKFKNQPFQVHLTETVGTNTWYRGTLNGKTVWIHSSYLTAANEQATSRLGHIRNRDVKIYPSLDFSSYITAGAEYTNYVYYIKKQLSINGELYYLISRQPSATSGIVGWVHESGLSSYPHVTIDKKSKTFYINGTGSAYAKAWGGRKDIVFEDLTKYKNQTFQVHLTESVGNDIWYRGVLDGKTVWIHSNHLDTSNIKRTHYNITLERALQLQLNASPQTDKKYAYVYKTYVKDGKVYLTNPNTKLNVRSEPSTRQGDNSVIGQLSHGDTLKVLGEHYSNWYTIEYTKGATWRQAIPSDVLYYLNPNNFVNDEKQRFQFLVLDKLSGASATALNNYLKGKGTLAGQGQAFIDAGSKHGINEIYLLSHALHETGHGTSQLALGVEVGTDNNGNPVLVTSKNRSSLKNIKKVYNMYGIHAFDSCPLECGAKKAYQEGWDTPYKAIVGGAAFIGNSYIKQGLNTLYKMRWNPAAMVNSNYIGKQYATDIAWASKQVNTMYNLYNQIGIKSLNLDIPVYK